MASNEPFMSSVDLWPLDWAPVNWAPCNGALLSIAEYSALFALLGTRYGGNGTTNFALPDLRGRVPVGMGQGPGTSSYMLGQTGGAEDSSFRMTADQMPSHTHAASGTVSPGSATSTGKGASTSQSPTGNYCGTAGTPIYGTPANEQMAESPVTVTVQPAGSSQPTPVNVMQPYIVLNYIIALLGTFPSRP